MTGTGTSSDPYVPTTWNEFVTAIGTSNAYVSCPADTVWDMNEIAISGIKNTISVNCVEIQGNNTTIKNLYCSAGCLFYFGYNSSVTKNCSIYRLNIINFEIENCLIDVGNYSGVYYYQSKFSGISNGASKNAIFDCNKQPLHFLAINKGCSFNIVAQNGIAFATGYYNNYCVFEHAHIMFNGKNLVYYKDSNAVALNNCLLEGSIDTVDYLRGANSVINVDCQSATAYSIYDVKNILVNSDKCNSIGKGLVAVTTNQLTDAAYLSSIGFPIGVD